MRNSELNVSDKLSSRAEKENIRKDGIIAAAEYLFYLHGVSRTTTTMIASKAMVSKRAIYDFFSTKEDIYLAVIAKNKKMFVDLPRPESENLPIYEVLLKIFRLDLEEEADVHRIQFLQLFKNESVESPDKIQELYESRSINPRELLIDWLEKQVKNGRITIQHYDDLKVYAGMLMNIVFGALTPSRRSFDDLNTRKEHIKKALLIFLKGIDCSF